MAGFTCTDYCPLALLTGLVWTYLTPKKLSRIRVYAELSGNVNQTMDAKHSPI